MVCTLQPDSSTVWTQTLWTHAGVLSTTPGCTKRCRSGWFPATGYFARCHCYFRASSKRVHHLLEILKKI